MGGCCCVTRTRWRGRCPCGRVSGGSDGGRSRTRGSGGRRHAGSDARCVRRIGSFLCLAGRYPLSGVRGWHLRLSGGDAFGGGRDACCGPCPLRRGTCSRFHRFRDACLTRQACTSSGSRRWPTYWSGRRSSGRRSGGSGRCSATGRRLARAGAGRGGRARRREHGGSGSSSWRWVGPAVAVSAGVACSVAIRALGALAIPIAIRRSNGDV